jgi:hypothetical protein
MTKTPTLQIETPYEAARAALGRRVLSDPTRDPWDTEDALQEAALAAALADESFRRKGLPESRSGRKGYMVLSAQRAGVTVLANAGARRRVETPTEAETLAEVPAPSVGAYEAVERRALVAAVLAEVDQILGSDAYALAHELLGQSETRVLTAGRPHAQLRTAADVLGWTAGKVQSVFYGLEAFFQRRAEVYSAL